MVKYLDYEYETQGRKIDYLKCIKNKVERLTKRKIKLLQQRSLNIHSDNLFVDIWFQDGLNIQIPMYKNENLLNETINDMCNWVRSK